MDIFEKILNIKLPTGETVGKNVKVTTRTPIPDVEDDDGQPTFDREEHTLFAQINIVKGTEKNIDGLLLKIGDGLASFQKKDIAYLNSDSYVDVTIQGINFHFKIIDVVPGMINISVPLKRVE